MELYVLELAVVAFVICGGLGMARKVSSCLGATDGVEALGRRRGRGGDDVQLRTGPVRRHLPPTTGDVVSGSDGLQQLLFNGVSQREADSTVPVIGEEPVVAGPHGHARSHQQRLVAGAGDL